MIKNAIDWVSRVRERGEPAYAAFRARVFALGSASTENTGGLRGLLALRQVLELGCGALVIPDQIVVGHAENAFDDMDNLKDARNAGAVKALARRLIELAQQLP
jgi:NAD(P)H-dependent FMN reductase